MYTDYILPAFDKIFTHFIKIICMCRILAGKPEGKRQLGRT
jgi:hypothetical protein